MLLWRALRLTRVMIEKNIGADRLADWAHIHENSFEIFREVDLPPNIQMSLVADRIGLWNFKSLQMMYAICCFVLLFYPFYLF